MGLCKCSILLSIRYVESKYKFSEHVLKEWHEMKTIEETMSIIHLVNHHRKINTLEELEILKWYHSRTKWPNVQTSPLISDLNSQPKQQQKFRNLAIKIISDLNSNCQLPSEETEEETSTPNKTCWECWDNNVKLTGKKNKTI